MNSIRINRFARFVPGAFTWATHAKVARKIVKVAVPGLFLLLTACGGNMEDPKIELNPHPAMHYVVTIVFNGAPGAFDTIKASAQYEVTNRDCVPEQPISGATILPSKQLWLDLHRVNEGVYETDLYIDQIKDENYFSKGRCRWSLVAVSAKASHGRMQFVTPLFVPRFFEERGIANYFSFASYNDANTALLNTGNENRAAYPHPSETFSVQVSAREARR
ncbi:MULTISPECIES: hypothetical protein [Luteibacter]|uniref:hypothetical protein n=1 Tax=Luteibacter TaxID=242605 RepID=UPI000565CFF7|nr:MULTISPECIES: hypothetical protein [unclassified Luteibacter]